MWDNDNRYHMKKTSRKPQPEHRRKSRRREAVLGALLASKGHLSAEGAHREAAKACPGIGLATVYRVLKQLLADGEALEFTPADGVARYEAAGRAHHDHLICLACGSFIEASDPALERLQDRLAARHGFTPSSHRLVIYGTCAACSGKKAVWR